MNLNQAMDVNAANILRRDNDNGSSGARTISTTDIQGNWVVMHL